MPTLTQAGYTPSQQPVKPPPPKPKKGKRKRRKRAGGKATVVSIVLFLVAVCIGSATLYIYGQTAPYANAYAPGTFLSGYALVGTDQPAAQALLAKLTEDAIAAWRYTLTWQGREFALTAQDIALTVDSEATLTPLWQVGHEGGMLARYRDMLAARAEPVQTKPVLQYDMDAVDAWLSQLTQAVVCDAVDATVTYTPENSEPFTFTAEQAGRALDTAPLRARIEAAIQALTPGEEALAPQVIAPKVTQAMLANIELRGRATLTAKQGAEANANAALALRALSGVRLAPGETLSFNALVGARTAQAGYVSAPEPAYGENVVGIGGGVSAAATALYQAALLADIPVRERHAAIAPVAYCGAGLEAAVSDQGLDLVLVNETQADLFVHARAYTEADALVLVVELLGEPLAGWRTLEASQQVIPAPTEPLYVRDSEGRYATYTDERVPVGEAKPGCLATVDVVTVGDAGTELARTRVSTDTYEPVAQAIYVGVRQR